MFLAILDVLFFIIRRAIIMILIRPFGPHTNDRSPFLSQNSTTTAKPLKMSDTALKFGPEW